MLVSTQFTYSSPGLLVGGRVRSNLDLDVSERLKRKENKKFYVKNHHNNNNNRVRVRVVNSYFNRKRVVHVSCQVKVLGPCCHGCSVKDYSFEIH